MLARPTLWKDQLPTRAQATPMICETDDKEFVAMMTGGDHRMRTPAGDYVIVYALPDKH